jgi:hypothetical protein
VWKWLAESVTGTAHVRGGLPCQDACLVRPAGGALVIACADGAGSAAHAEVGARLACETLASVIESDLREGQTVAAIDRDALAYWLGAARKELEAEAGRRSTKPRELACTVMAAVVGDDAAAFAHLGDGAIVRADGETYAPVFWPEAGEYANETRFLTEADFEKHFLFATHAGRVEELAVFTDGLQRLALDFAGRTGHAGFFRPLFQRLREADDPAGLAGPLRDFLGSERVNQRSDDDKTLILATRVTAGAPATNPS